MLSELDKKIIRELQQDIPICSRPYEAIAKKLSITEEEVMDKINAYMEKGIIRKFRAILNHRKVGLTSNGMVVWEVPVDRILETGAIMSSYKEVTHCYERPTFPDWPYNLFTMIHAKTKEQCEEVIQKLALEANIRNYKALYSTAELKKTSMIYFGDES